MPAPALLLGLVKKRAVFRLVLGLLGSMVMVCVMAFCGSLALVAFGAQSTTAACSTGVAGTNAGVTIQIPNRAPALLTVAQVTVAKAYISVGHSRSVPDGGIAIALMMSLQESGLRMLANASVPESLNYPHDGTGSDHDSVGSAQQRSSAGWGSVANLMNPVYNAAAFYGGPSGPNHGSPRGLLDVSGWASMDKGVAVQAVQGSAFPERYAQWQPEAEAIVSGLGGSTGLAPCDISSPGSGQPSKPANLDQARKQIIAYAQPGMGGTNVWGGTAFKAWDCSGYVQWVFGQA